uniref:Uncharacterized protein n=1 Tax=Romanomermis culicivorax TaxID=13658 RepID=A0A915I9A1_ROMCU
MSLVVERNDIHATLITIASNSSIEVRYGFFMRFYYENRSGTEIISFKFREFRTGSAIGTPFPEVVDHMALGDPLPNKIGKYEKIERTKSDGFGQMAKNMWLYLDLEIQNIHRNPRAGFEDHVPLSPCILHEEESIEA